MRRVMDWAGKVVVMVLVVPDAVAMTAMGVWATMLERLAML
jgi:hypothetical protein